VLAAAVLATLALTPASASAADLGLQLSLAPGGEQRSSVELALEPGATQTSIPVYVRKADGGELEGLRLSADISGATVEITPDGGAAGATAKLEKDGLLRFTVLAKDVAHQQVSGKLIASAGANFQTLADLNVTRPPAAQALAIEGAGDDGIERTSDVALVRLALTIVSKQRDDISDLRVAVTPFTAETQDQVHPDVQMNGRANEAGTVATIGGNAAVPLDISANLESGGIWISAIRLTYGGQTTVVPIKVTRNRAALTVAFDEVPEVHGGVAIGGARDIVFRVPVTETGGRTVDLQRPVLILKRVDGASSEQARYDRFTFDGRSDGSSRLTPGQSKMVDLKVFGVEGAGEYSATLRFRGAGGQPQDVATKAWLRVDWWWALLVLGAAVIAGEVVRRLRTERLVSVRTQTELALLNDQLEQAARNAEATDEDLPVLQSLRAFISELYGRVGRRPSDDVAADRTELEVKLRILGRWLAARRDARKAGWPGDSRAELDLVGEFLRTRGDSDPKESSARLQKVEALLRAGPDVEEALTVLDQASREWLPGSQATDAEKNAVTTAIAEARAKLRDGNVAEAEKAYDEAAAKLAAVAASELLALITTTEVPPEAEQEWDRLRAELTDASTKVANAASPKDAVAAYRSAYARYLQVLAEGLRKQVQSRHEELKTEARRGATHDLADIAETERLCERAKQKADGGMDLAGARADYEAARSKVDALKQAGRMGPETKAPALSAPEIPTRGSVGAQPSILIPTGAVADRRRKRLEFGANGDRRGRRRRVRAAAPVLRRSRLGLRPELPHRGPLGSRRAHCCQRDVPERAHGVVSVRHRGRVRMRYRRVDLDLVVKATGDGRARAMLGHTLVGEASVEDIDFEALRGRIRTRVRTALPSLRGGRPLLRRLLIHADDARVAGLPWERAAPPGWTAVRVSGVPARALAQRLTLPLRIALAGVDADVARSLARLDDGRSAALSRVRAASLDEWWRDAEIVVADVLHLDHAIPTRALMLGRPDVVGTLGWAVRTTSLLQTRLLVVQSGSEDDLRRARSLAQAVADRGGPAVIVAPSGADIEFLYDAILDDEPLDAVVSAIPGSTLVAGENREDGLRIAAVAADLVSAAQVLTHKPKIETAARPGYATSGAGELADALRERGVDDPGWLLLDAVSENFERPVGSRRWFPLNLRAVREPPPNARVVARAMNHVRERADIAATAVVRPPDVGPRFVNLALEGRGRRLDQRRETLRAGRAYELAFAIGPRDTELVAFNQRALVEKALFHHPAVSGRWVEVGVVGLDFDVEGATVQQLWLPQTGPTQTARFKVVPRRTGLVRARVCLYADNGVVQSHLFAGMAEGPGMTAARRSSAALADALGMRPASARGLRWSWRLEYDAASEATEILKRRPRTIGIVAHLEDHAVITVKGTDVAATTRDDGNLVSRVETLRLLLQQISNPDPNNPKILPDRWPYRFPDENRGEEDDLHATLGDLAQAGYGLFWTAFKGADQDALRDELAKEPGRIEIAHLVLKKVVPWAAVYDRHYDADSVDPPDAPAPRVVARACTAPLRPDAPRDLRCGGDSACLLHPKAPPPGDGEIVTPDTVACPLHFWGFRHEIEVPPRQASNKTTRLPAAAFVRNTLPTRVAVAMHGGLASHASHLTALRTILGKAQTELVGPAYLRRDVIAQLKDEELDVVYLYCHADGGEGTNVVNPRLRFAPDGGKPEASLTSEQLPTEFWEHSPLVVLNGCRTGAFRADALSPFVTFLVDKHAAGVLATQIEIDERLAAEVGKSVVSAFVRGERIAEALLTARRELLVKNNPLGLAYTLFADGDLRLEVKP